MEFLGKIFSIVGLGWKIGKNRGLLWWHSAWRGQSTFVGLGDVAIYEAIFFAKIAKLAIFAKFWSQIGVAIFLIFLKILAWRGKIRGPLWLGGGKLARL